MPDSLSDLSGCQTVSVTSLYARQFEWPPWMPNSLSDLWMPDSLHDLLEYQIVWVTSLDTSQSEWHHVSSLPFDLYSEVCDSVNNPHPTDVIPCPTYQTHLSAQPFLIAFSSRFLTMAISATYPGVLSLLSVSTGRLEMPEGVMRLMRYQVKYQHASSGWLEMFEGVYKVDRYQLSTAN